MKVKELKELIENAENDETVYVYDSFREEWVPLKPYKIKVK